MIYNLQDSDAKQLIKYLKLKLTFLQRKQLHFALQFVREPYPKKIYAKYKPKWHQIFTYDPIQPRTYIHIHITIYSLAALNTALLPSSRETNLRYDKILARANSRSLHSLYPLLTHTQHTHPLNDFISISIVSFFSCLHDTLDRYRLEFTNSRITFDVIVRRGEPFCRRDKLRRFRLGQMTQRAQGVSGQREKERARERERERESLFAAGRFYGAAAASMYGFLSSGRYKVVSYYCAPHLSRLLLRR